MELRTSSRADAHPLFKSIDIQTLSAVRGLTAWVLERERAKRVGEALPAASTNLKRQLDGLPSAILIQGIQRHRLETVLQADSAVTELLPDLQVDLQRAARREMMEALALASLTRQMAVLFAEAGIPLLVIKGVLLALQTTGSPTARGRGDCDLFVDPSKVGEAIALLQSEGFAFSDGITCVGEDSLRGRYSRFLSIEISLNRFVGDRCQWIDLHWHASKVRGVVSDFQALWERAELHDINGQPVSTLSRRDAFLHACCHATNDRWQVLRNLVDIERLGMELPSDEKTVLNRLRPVRKSCLVLADMCAGREKSLFQGRAQAVSTKAQVAQQRPWRRVRDDEWSVANRLSDLLHYLNRSHHPVHLLSILLQQFIRPVDLIDSETGKYRSLWQVVSLRMGKLRSRLRASTE